jgi:hypothetical protein
LRAYPSAEKHLALITIHICQVIENQPLRDTFAPLPACPHILRATLILIMEIELHPAVSLLEEAFNVLIAPVEMLVDALNSRLNLQRYKILFISGNLRCAALLRASS